MRICFISSCACAVGCIWAVIGIYNCKCLQLAPLECAQSAPLLLMHLLHSTIVPLPSKTRNEHLPRKKALLKTASLPLQDPIGAHGQKWIWINRVDLIWLLHMSGTQYYTFISNLLHLVHIGNRCKKQAQEHRNRIYANLKFGLNFNLFEVNLWW